MLETVDAGRVAIGKFDLDGVAADGGGALSGDAGLEHGQQRGGSDGRAGRSHVRLFLTLVIAESAGAVVAQVGKVVAAGVTVGPGDFHALARGDAYFYIRGLLARILRYGHSLILTDLPNFTCWLPPTS